MSKRHHKWGKGECDRCGQIFKLSALSYEWTHLKVCNACWDPRPAQDFPRKLEAESEALWDPRPENDRVAGLGRIRGEYEIIGRDWLGTDLGISGGEVTLQ